MDEAAKTTDKPSVCFSEEGCKETRCERKNKVGGEKTKKKKRHAKTFAEILADELNVIDEKTGQPRKHFVIHKLIELLETATPKEATKIFEMLRDTLGEEPTRKHESKTAIKTIGNWRDIPLGEINKEDGKKLR